MGDYDNHGVEFKTRFTNRQAEQLLEKLREAKEDGEVKSVTIKVDPEVAHIGIRQLERQVK